MSTLFPDTSPEAEAVLIDLLRVAPPWRKLEMMNRLNASMHTLLISGLRRRHPEANDREIRRRLADLLLGPKLAEEVYGPPVNVRSKDTTPKTMNNEATNVTLLVTSVFEALDIPYVIGGSLASTLHGVARTTLDSDLIADVRMEHVTPLIERLGNEFYIFADAVIDAIIHRGSFNLIHLATMFKVDVFVAKDRSFERSQLSNRRAVAITSDPQREAYVAGAEDTILAKLEWFRLGGEVSDRQWRDVLGILQVQGGRLDIDYLSRMAEELDVVDLLERAIRKTGRASSASPSL